jgi:hypothetical protein
MFVGWILDQGRKDPEYRWWVGGVDILDRWILGGGHGMVTAWECDGSETNEWRWLSPRYIIGIERVKIEHD